MVSVNYIFAPDFYFGMFRIKLIHDERNRLQKALQYSEDKSGDALLVWIDGELILEEYHNGYNPAKPHILAEVSTLFSGLTALAAEDDGLIDLHEPVSETITEWKNAPQKSKITIFELLNLTSGIEGGTYRSIPTYEQAIQTPFVYPPGKQFLYGPNAFQVFGMLMMRKAGAGGYHVSLGR